ncbi:DUF2007 domain-containing protein [Vibrio sp. CAU 1672]|uniref:putative signal transducing protein n=1 Tax=Vibrio sp. CAU 1672 TaxID=3032594 RepID=UPI0023DA6347|nr:DUF2007 domain-containing protein [Vibrio sp. CAU 1672]MDF2153676.1 DUF2007 domain-containing protein [Vibrio sp. CAU 1672]
MKIYIAENPAEAHILCGLLKTENIACEVRGEGLFGLKGEVPFGDETDPYVWLFQPEQQQQAMAIITEYHNQTAGILFKDWICPNCNENNEGQFGACWQCGYQIKESR